VIVGTLTEVVATSPTVSNPVWSFDANSPFVVAPMPSGPSVYIGSDAGTVYSLDSATGAQNWVVALGQQAVATAMVLSPAGDMVYFGADNSSVFALFTGSGSLGWTVSTQAPITSAPAVDTTSGNVIVGGGDGFVYCLNGRTGFQQWRFRNPSSPVAMVWSPPAVVPGQMVVLGSDDHSVYALNTHGLQLWSFATDGPVNSQPAIDVHGIVFAGESAGGRGGEGDEPTRGLAH
jgi:outer membrane protein assembly factor BamB